MKIAFISLFKKGLGGGEGQAAHELAQHFALDHQAALICSGDTTGLSEGENGLQVFSIQSAGDDLVCIPALSAGNVKAILAFLDEFQPGVVHAHEPALLGLIGQMWAKMHRVPFVYTAHVLPSKILNFGAAELVHIGILRSSLAGSVTRQILTSFFENCDALIALNAAAVEDLRQFGYAGNIFAISNGRDLQQYRACRHADISSPEKIVTFVGFISERKNQRYLIQVLERLPRNYRLQIIGEPLNPAYGQQLKDYCQKHQLDNVVFTGQVPHEAIPSYLEKTHVFVSASRMEVQSLAVIEALASGTPVVGLSNETIDELVDEQVGFRLPKEADPGEFARCVERICNLAQPAYDQMCERARERVRHLDWSNVVALTTEAYESLLAEKAPVTHAASVRLADLISMMPPGEVRDILAGRVTALGKTLQEKALLEPVASKIRQVRSIPGSTWFFAGLTIPISVASYMFLRSTTSLSRVIGPASRRRPFGFTQSRLDRLRRRHWQALRLRRATHRSPRRPTRSL